MRSKKSRRRSKKSWRQWEWPKKCAVVHGRVGRLSVEGDLPLTQGREIPELEEGQSYKYLGVAQRTAQVVQSNQERVVQEYMRRVRKVWDAKLNAHSRMQTHNSWAVSVLRCSFSTSQ